MDKKAILESIESFRNSLISLGIKTDKIILFGSYANDTATADSDIDLIVISDSFVNMGYWQRLNILSDAICEVFLPIEATAMTQAEFDSKTYFAADYAINGIAV